jgi:hypothetical protein
LKKFIEGTKGGRKWDEGSAYIELLKDEDVKRDWKTVVAIQPSVIKSKFSTLNQQRKKELAEQAKNSSTTKTTTNSSTSFPKIVTTTTKMPSSKTMKESLRAANESIPSTQAKWKLSGPKEEIFALFTRLESNQGPPPKTKSQVRTSSRAPTVLELPVVDEIPLVEPHEAIIGLIESIDEQDKEEEQDQDEPEVEFEF